MKTKTMQTQETAKRYDAMLGAIATMMLVGGAAVRKWLRIHWPVDGLEAWSDTRCMTVSWDFGKVLGQDAGVRLPRHWCDATAEARRFVVKITKSEIESLRCFAAAAAAGAKNDGGRCVVCGRICNDIIVIACVDAPGSLERCTKCLMEGFANANQKMREEFGV